MVKRWFSHIALFSMILLTHWSYGDNSNELTELVRRKLDEFKENQQRDYHQWSEILEKRLDNIVNKEKASEKSCLLLPLVQLDGNSYYFATEMHAPWKTAFEFCQQQGLRLLKIESQRKNQVIKSYIKSIGKGGNYWISGTDLNDEGKFYWVQDGEPIAIKDLNPWSPNQPDNWQGNENCIEIWEVDYKWNDRDCTNYKNFICEM